MFKVGDKVRRSDKYLFEPMWTGYNGVLTVSNVIDSSLYFREMGGGFDQWKFESAELTAAKKDDNGKPRFDFLFGLHGLNHLCTVFSAGELKYGDPYNFRKSKSDVSYKLRLVGASLRHIYAYVRGERLDKESGLPHVAHAICNLLMVLDLEEA